MEINELPFKHEIIDKYNGSIYLVGGAVRDEFFGNEFKDLDLLITNIPLLKLEEILSKYGNVNSVGKSFGILKLKLDNESEEIDITIPRTEKPTDDGGHRGFNVVSDHELSIKDDLMRRDFTINAIAKNISNNNIADPFNGVNDIKNKIIRVVNSKAFIDDPLRMLRAIQFASRFNFKIESKTFKMIKDNAYRIKEISSERILIEFDKIVKKGNKLTGATYLKKTGILDNIIGENVEITKDIEWENIKTMGEFIYSLMHNTTINGNDIADFYKNNLKGGIFTHKEIKALQYGFENFTDNSYKNRKIAYKMHSYSPDSLISKILPMDLQKAATELYSGKYPKKINELTINGNDLIELGFHGKEIGNKLESLLTNIYADNINNNREELLNLLGKN